MKKIIFSCEHGGNDVPEAYRYLFKGHRALLDSHRGWDPGALALARAISNQLNLPLYFSTVSRLLVELNRSLHHPNLFSGLTKNLPEEDKQNILTYYYFPHRQKVESEIRKMISEGDEVVHLSIHSFTPIFNSVERHCHLGLLYDPQRVSEKKFARQWKIAILKEAPELIVRFNYPYLGKADGFTSYLRKQFNRNYTGIELEVNQSLLEAKEGIRMINTLSHSFPGL